ncbi:RNA polymerase III subunit Rpc25 [Penicillium chrysogenum]|uniref:DNA-directed RNA polymerase subunit n=1 Tax=Penicillium chrysogenum TaxID=5076 RepID=A0ABQ8WGZ8_PENCH|nr:RNA polymerase III subunit Rpc25 [Penicillium chrysogenum]KAJ5250397.1 RNA polymerase III subunit Rpc25 [Penicillium chrysogenum]KAJ5266010.1 RNA polymerase III subunit Rpc25 [Penicillium chrysogenum]KAJ5269299.1 RNA polymerase III subunit Rpc25 [Penicillium chrysogenum]KAJ6147986.1 RNA polymerase III subunit Rpc25 [Penicillium chrysogenum]
MFILTTISDLIQISPEDFSKFSAVALEDNINAKYANKVIQKIGLCISFYDLLESSDGLIGHGTGLVNVNVKFRMIVFRPFKGEIMLGKISSGTEHGIKIGLEFFNDILIPPQMLMEKSRFDYAEQVWIWESEGGTEFFFDVGEVVRFRVESEEWHDQIPNAPDVADETPQDRRPPYSILICNAASAEYSDSPSHRRVQMILRAVLPAAGGAPPVSRPVATARSIVICAPEVDCM